MTHKYCLMTHRPSFTLKLVSHSTIYPKTYPWDLHQKVNSKKNCKMSGCIAKYLFRLCSVRFLKFMWRTRATTRNAIRSPMMSNATWIIYGQKWNFSFLQRKKCYTSFMEWSFGALSSFHPSLWNINCQTWLVGEASFETEIYFFWYGKIKTQRERSLIQIDWHLYQNVM